MEECWCLGLLRKFGKCVSFLGVRQISKSSVKLTKRSGEFAGTRVANGRTTNASNRLSGRLSSGLVRFQTNAIILTI